MDSVLTPLSEVERQLLDAARRATLATIAPDGRPRLVPVCFALGPGDGDGDDAGAGQSLWIPLDGKPKRGDDPRALARVRDILDRPSVTVLVDRWSEDWSELAWLRIDGVARLVEARDVPPAVVDALVARYPQYATHDLPHRPAICVAAGGWTSWSATPTP